MEAVLKVGRVHTDPRSWNNEQVNKLFSSIEWHDIAYCPWEAEFPYKPNVRFQILHSDSTIYIRYEVKEEFVKAQYIRPNENVYEDSCVEFFISLDNRQTYYNFEFNVLGTGLIGYGSAVKADRHRLTASTIEQVETYSEAFRVDGKKIWSIALSIPKIILEEQIEAGYTAFANFYKCGDSLPQPHFLAWNNINSPAPNFHQPQFFGKLIFE